MTFAEVRKHERFQWSEGGCHYVKLDRSTYQLVTNPNLGGSERVPGMFYRVDDPTRPVARSWFARRPNAVQS